jgi:hypothetical protein
VQPPVTPGYHSVMTAEAHGGRSTRHGAVGRKASTRHRLSRPHPAVGTISRAVRGNPPLRCSPGEMAGTTGRAAVEACKVVHRPPDAGARGHAPMRRNTCRESDAKQREQGGKTSRRMTRHTVVEQDRCRARYALRGQPTGALTSEPARENAFLGRAGLPPPKTSSRRVIDEPPRNAPRTARPMPVDSAGVAVLRARSWILRPEYGPRRRETYHA